MATRLAELMFEQQLTQLEEEVDAKRWVIDKQDGLALHVTLYPKRAPNEAFTARVAWKEFPGRLPASIRFIDPETGATGVNGAWPVAAGFRPPQDICANWTAEGFEAHPEWLNDPKMKWDHGDNAILTQLRTLQFELDRSFQERFHG
jgi:hypothetical protein